jgi:hypothetical protein
MAFSTCWSKSTNLLNVIPIPETALKGCSSGTQNLLLPGFANANRCASWCLSAKISDPKRKWKKSCVLAKNALHSLPRMHVESFEIRKSSHANPELWLHVEGDFWNQGTRHLATLVAGLPACLFWHDFCSFWQIFDIFLRFSALSVSGVCIIRNPLTRTNAVFFLSGVAVLPWELRAGSPTQPKQANLNFVVGKLFLRVEPVRSWLTPASTSFKLFHFYPRVCVYCEHVLDHCSDGSHFSRSR